MTVELNEMEDAECCEPLNLVKKSKPVAIVAPSSVIGVGGLSHDGRDVEKPAPSMAKGLLESPETWGTSPELGIHSMVHSLAACEQSFLTALYMGSLMARGYPSFSPVAGLPPNSQPAEVPWQSQQLFWPGVNWSEGLRPQTNEALHHSKTAPLSIVTSDRAFAKKAKLRRSSALDHKNSSSSGNDGGKSQDSGHASNNQDKKKPHIKKPLNAFMLYMKEMRAKVVAECTLKESAAINQILGRRWHSLSRDEQAKYYEKARQERQLHMELYPGWSARDNYGYGAKKKKRKKERVAIVDTGGNSMKKCRARYGLDQQSQWCKPCRRKKKCIRYMECGDDEGDGGTQSDGDNLGSCGSVGDALTPPEDDMESFHQSLSSPGGLSGLSSLTSPSMILPSPSASMASPSVSLASPCMSLQSPLTPHGLDYDVKPPPPPSLTHMYHHPPHRLPVGTNPHDVNNPLSVNQLTGKCIKNSSSSSSASASSSSGKDSPAAARAVISVT